jgi:hypothetical protein
MAQRALVVQEVGGDEALIGTIASALERALNLESANRTLARKVLRLLRSDARAAKTCRSRAEARPGARIRAKPETMPRPRAKRRSCFAPWETRARYAEHVTL